MTRTQRRTVPVGCAALALALAVVAVTRPARSDAPCGPAERAWATVCGGSRGGVEAFQCPPGHVVLAVSGADGAPAFVDATRGAPGLRQVAGVGLSPVGEFADFRAAPAPVREALARMAACVERDPALLAGEVPGGASATSGSGSGSGTSETPAARVAPSLPWCLLIGLTGLVAMSPRRRPRASSVRRGAALVALTVAVFALARTAPGPSFFHQNGHGPNWIGYALGEPCPYGPGFAELFGWAARMHPGDPEARVFACNGALAALCPALAWVVARRAGAGRSLAWAVALAVALDPLLLRVAFTESYYGPIATLLLAATAIALSAPTLRLRSPRFVLAPSFVLAQASAALLAAQAARVHPVGWVAVATVPLAHLARPGSPARALRSALAATLVMAGVVAAAAGPAMLEVLRGVLGARYVPEVERGSIEGLASLSAVLAAAAMAITLVRRGHARGAARAALPLVVFAAALAGTSLLHIDVDWVRAAHAHMFLASCVAAAVGVVAIVPRRWARQRAATWLALGLGLVNAMAHLDWLTDLPTDSLELRRALVWRCLVPPGARLVAVESAGIMALQLPFYASTLSAAPAPVVRLDAHGTPPPLGSFGDHVYYYRSSLCSTAAARPWCDALEAGAQLEPVALATLPARPSTHATDYDTPDVRVGLYRVLGKGR